MREKERDIKPPIDPKNKDHIQEDVWMMDELQREISLVLRQMKLRNLHVSDSDIERIVFDTVETSATSLYKILRRDAASVLEERRIQRLSFEKRNEQRWHPPFNFLEALLTSCQELGHNFNRANRVEAVEQQDYLFECLTHLHAKACLVSAEVLCLMRGGFADGAVARWRTLYEISVIAKLLSSNGQELALRYLANSKVRAWENAEEQDFDETERVSLAAQAESALARFGNALKKRNGWACELTGQGSPTFEKMADVAGEVEGKSLYHNASEHVHANHRALDDLLGLCETEDDILLAGPSNAGMVAPLTLTAMSLMEVTIFLLMCKPNLDRMVFSEVLRKAATRMHKLAIRVEKRSLDNARKGKAKDGI